MAEQLRSLMGTQYITEEHCGQLREVLSKTSEVDLANCKFIAGAAAALEEFYGSVMMCDTRNETRNGILQHNCKAARIPQVEAELLPTDVKGAEDAIKLFKSIDRTKVYKLDFTNFDKKKSKAFTIALLMKFPEIKVDLGSSAGEVFRIVRSDWLPYAEHHERYWRSERQSITEIKCINGKMRDFDGKEYHEGVYVNEFNVLPCEFGSVNVTELPEFRTAWMSALKELQKTEVSKKRMIDYVSLA